MDSGEPKEACIIWGPDPNTKGQLLGERMCLGIPDNTAVSCAKMAELIDLPFGLCTQVGERKHKFNRIFQVVSMCPHARAHWRHLVNTIDPSVCGNNAALCQITFSTCY